MLDSLHIAAGEMFERQSIYFAHRVPVEVRPRSSERVFFFAFVFRGEGCMGPGKGRVRRAFTLIELLVVIAIIGVLIALLLPAVQMAREAARRNSCINNLKQMALATANYVDVNNSFPLTGYDGNTWGTGASSTNSYGAKARILPFLDQGNVYDSINFSHGSRWNNGWKNGEYNGDVVNYSAWHRRMSLFICPSDPYPGNTDNPGNSNYGVNYGVSRYVTNWRPNGMAQTPSPWDGALDDPEPIRIGSVTDGTSKTALFSEWIKGPANGNWVSSQTNLVYQMSQTPVGFGAMNDPTLLDRMQKDCQLQAANSGAGLISGWRGEYWIWQDSYRGDGGYGHSFPPNTPPCVHGDANFERSVNSDVLSATSMHPGGVCVALVDGSVQFYSNSVSIAIWRALGTRANNDNTQ
jgi:prepilin-type N-terminal cleavage/methylation domain-containing protein